MAAKEKRHDFFMHFVMVVISVICILPLILLVVVSLSSEESLVTNGYSFFPTGWSIDAYKYLFYSATIYKAYGMSIFVTIVGTIMALSVNTLLAYTLSIRNLPGRRILNFIVFFTMLFSGGLVPSYMMWTQMFGIKNTIWAYLLPNLVANGFNVMIMRTYFETNVPKELLESARVDGANEFTTLFRIVLPISLPIMATIGLMSGLAYWNDWTNGLYYITDKNLNTVQVFLNNMLINAQQLEQMGTAHGLDMSSMPSIAVRMAVAVAGALPLVCVFPFFQKYFVKGMTLGAVKG